jgi:hypothetical protein
MLTFSKAYRAAPFPECAFNPSQLILPSTSQSYFAKTRRKVHFSKCWAQADSVAPRNPQQYKIFSLSHLNEASSSPTHSLHQNYNPSHSFLQVSLKKPKIETHFWNAHHRLTQSGQQLFKNQKWRFAAMRSMAAHSPLNAGHLNAVAVLKCWMAAEIINVDHMRNQP